MNVSLLSPGNLVHGNMAGKSYWEMNLKKGQSYIINLQKSLQEAILVVENLGNR